MRPVQHEVRLPLLTYVPKQCCSLSLGLLHDISRLVKLCTTNPMFGGSRDTQGCASSPRHCRALRASALQLCLSPANFSGVWCTTRSGKRFRFLNETGFSSFRLFRLCLRSQPRCPWSSRQRQFLDVVKSEQFKRMTPICHAPGFVVNGFDLLEARPRAFGRYPLGEGEGSAPFPSRSLITAVGEFLSEGEGRTDFSLAEVGCATRGSV